MKRKNRKKGQLTICSLIAAVAVILLNIFVTRADWTYDVSEDKLYTLSEETKQVMEQTEKKVNLYVLVRETDCNVIFQKIIQEFDKISNQIHVEYKDLEQYPNFPYEYIDSSSQTATEGSIIVECGGKFRYLSAEQFVSYGYDYATYEQTVQSIDLESQLTEAIYYVISDRTPVVYSLTGHKEKEIDSSLESQFYSDNFTLKELNLLTEEEVPADCAVLFINGPSSDISKEDGEKILRYLKKEGKVYFVADPLAEDLPNFSKLFEAYGIKMEPGIVVEADDEKYTQTPTYLLPELGYSKVTAPIQEQYVLVPVAKGFTRGEDTTEYTITPLLNTSDIAYSKVNTDSKVVDKEPEDVDGPFSISLQVDTKEGGKMILLGSVNVLNEQIDSVVSGTNLDFFMNGINYLAEQEDKISVGVKTLTAHYAQFPASAQRTLMIVTTFVIPGLTLLTGGIVIWRRKKK